MFLVNGPNKSKKINLYTWMFGWIKGLAVRTCKLQVWRCCENCHIPWRTWRRAQDSNANQRPNLRISKQTNTSWVATVFGVGLVSEGFDFGIYTWLADCKIDCNITCGRTDSEVGRDFWTKWELFNCMRQDHFCGAAATENTLTKPSFEFEVKEVRSANISKHTKLLSNIQRRRSL